MGFEALITGYELWIQQLLKQEWDVCYVTFEFNHLSYSQTAATERMKQEIERFYVTLLTNVVRHPTRMSQVGDIPQLFGFPDRPVAKRTSTYRLADVVPNMGIHVHAFVATPPKSRLKESLHDHIKQNSERYTGNQQKVRSLHVMPIIRLEGRLVDYTFKNIKRRMFTTDDILIYPKASSELQEMKMQARSSEEMFAC
jgi:hypothetical protein